jgi:hypothetical protein
MAGLVPAIHVFLAAGGKDVDARHRAGHDEFDAAMTRTNMRLGDVFDRRPRAFAQAAALSRRAH